MLLALAIYPSLQAQTPAPTGVLVDQVIAVVNGDLVLESDVDEERRFDSFKPISDPTGAFSRQTAVDDLINRTLILQQARQQPGDAVTLDEARAQLKSLRPDIPACKQYRCDTDAGWQKFVTAQGFTLPTLEEHWRERMEILKFIELRFRAGIRITPAEIKTYYDNSLLPEYKKQNAPAPPLEAVSDRIEEILLQRQVGSLLEDWLKSLKAQGTVRVIQPAEVTP